MRGGGAGEVGAAIRVVDQVAGEEHGPEASTEPDATGIAHDALDARWQGSDHGGTVVDTGDRVPHHHQGPGDPARTTAKVEDARAWPDDAVDQLGFARGGQTAVEGDGAAVGRDLARTVGHPRRGQPAATKAGYLATASRT